MTRSSCHEQHSRNNQLKTRQRTPVANDEAVVIGLKLSSSLLLTDFENINRGKLGVIGGVGEWGNVG